MPNNAYRPQPGRLGLKNTGSDYNASINALLTMQKDDGSVTYYLWVDSTGRLRIKNAAPTSDTDGTIVGTQS